MEERNCKDCVFNSYAHHGCVSWDCEYINRREAVKAYKELHKEDKYVQDFPELQIQADQGNGDIERR